MTKNAFDYIVVGGGSAGCIVAARLAEAKASSVLLLEAGDAAEKNPETLSADGFKYAFANDRVMLDRMSTPQTHCAARTLYTGSGLGMGGSGSVNGMVYTRGDKLDFDQWPEGWQWRDVEPGFKALEQKLHIRHRQETDFTRLVIEAAVEAGFSHKDGLNDGVLNGFIGYNDMNFEGVYRRSSYVAFIKDAPTHDNLYIKTQCLVRKIIFNENKTATGVDVEINNQRQTFTVNKEVILCAGTLETPKLLMLSGIGSKQHLQDMDIALVNETKGIGDNLQDHPNVTVFYRGKKPVDFAYPQVYGFSRCNKSTHLPGNQADVCLAMLAAAVTVQQSLKRMAPANMLKGDLFFNPILKTAIRCMVKAALLVPAINKFINNLYGIAVILGKPASRGHLRLKSGNIKDPAHIDLNYFEHPDDIQTLTEGIRLANQIASYQKLKAWGNLPLAKESQATEDTTIHRWIKKNAMTTFHYCGTCSMGNSDTSPVDIKLKLKGIKNVRIADASVIPVIPVSALNAPTMMVAWRAADFILDEQ